MVAAVAAGVVFFRVGGAPDSYAMLNIGSAVLALAMVAAMPVGRLRGRGAAWVAAVCLAGIAVTLVAGFDLDGVRRWLPLGPLRLHAAMLLLPAMLAALPHLPTRWQSALAAAASGSIVLQPDFAAALALAAGFAASSGRRLRDPVLAAGLGLALAAVAATAFRADALEPVRFVENVVADGFAAHVAMGLLISAALLFAIWAPLLRAGPDRRDAAGVTGAWAGFTVASLTGDYPTPLAGYGAAAILGYGLAVSALRGFAARP